MTDSIGFGGNLGTVSFSPTTQIPSGEGWIASFFPAETPDPTTTVTTRPDSATVAVGEAASVTMQGSHGGRPGAITAVTVADGGGTRLVGTSGDASSTAVLTVPVQQGAVGLTGTVAVATGEGANASGAVVEGHIVNVGGELKVVLDAPSSTAITLSGQHTISSRDGAVVETSQGATPSVTAGSQGRAELSTSFQEGSTTSANVFVQASDPAGPGNATTSAGGGISHEGPVNGGARFEAGTTGGQGFTAVRVQGGVTLQPVQVTGYYETRTTEGPNNDTTGWGVDTTVRITPGLTGTASVQHADTGAAPDRTTMGAGLAWQVNPYNQVGARVDVVDVGAVEAGAESGDHTRVTLQGSSQLSPGVTATVEYGTNVDGMVHDRLSGGVSVQDGNLTAGVEGYYEVQHGPDNDSWGVEGRVGVTF